MFKYKKLVLNICNILFIVFSLIETIIYLFCDNNIFGLYYLIINLLIIFFLVPCTYNYKKYYSTARISKLIIIIVLGIFNSYFLQLIINSSINYVDSSKIFINKIFIFKNILKGIVYFLLIIFTIFDSKLGKKIIKSISYKNVD